MVAPSRHTAKIHKDHIVLIEMLHMTALFTDRQIMEQRRTILPFPEKCSKHICHDTFPETPRPGDAEKALFFSDRRDQLADQGRFINKIGIRYDGSVILKRGFTVQIDAHTSRHSFPFTFRWRYDPPPFIVYILTCGRPVGKTGISHDQPYFPPFCLLTTFGPSLVYESK